MKTMLLVFAGTIAVDFHLSGVCSVYTACGVRGMVCVELGEDAKDGDQHHFVRGHYFFDEFAGLLPTKL